MFSTCVRREDPLRRPMASGAYAIGGRRQGGSRELSRASAVAYDTSRQREGTVERRNRSHWGTRWRGGCWFGGRVFSGAVALDQALVLHRGGLACMGLSGCA